MEKFYDGSNGSQLADKLIKGRRYLYVTCIDFAHLYFHNNTFVQIYVIPSYDIYIYIQLSKRIFFFVILRIIKTV